MSNREHSFERAQPQSSQHGNSNGRTRRGQDQPETGANKDYGQGLPPPGPPNWLITTPNFLPYTSDEGSKKRQ
jgi:hypothetical protein